MSCVTQKMEAKLSRNCGRAVRRLYYTRFIRIMLGFSGYAAATRARATSSGSGTLPDCRPGCTPDSEKKSAGRLWATSRPHVRQPVYDRFLSIFTSPSRHCTECACPRPLSAPFCRVSGQTRVLRRPLSGPAFAGRTPQEVPRPARKGRTGRADPAILTAFQKLVYHTHHVRTGVMPHRPRLPTSAERTQ